MISDDTLVRDIEALRPGIRNLLWRNGLTTAGLIRQKSDEQLAMCPGIGKTIIQRVRDLLGRKSSPTCEAVAILCEAMGDSLGYREVFSAAARRIRALH